MSSQQQKLAAQKKAAAKAKKTEVESKDKEKKAAQTTKKAADAESEEDDDAEDDDEETTGENKEQDTATDLSNPNVVTKYRTAADIVNATLKIVIAAAQADAKIVDLCAAGDKHMTEATSKIYRNDKKLEKGIAFPTCISINNVVGHFSPLATDTAVLKTGDLVKVDCGVHIDGYIAVGAHTFVVGVEKVTGRQADCIAAATALSDVAIRLLKAGNKNSQITDAFAKVVADYKVSLVQGVLSHQMSRFLIDGEKVIINKADTEHKVDDVEFAPNEVYAIDIVVSSGDGKPKEVDERTTVYKRNAEKTYQLKRQASREVLNDITKRFPTFPFTLRDMDEKKARFGIIELRDHELVQPYPVLHEKENEYVAHFKFTALITSNGTLKITGLPVDTTKVETEHKVVNEDIKKILATSAGQAKKKKKKSRCQESW